MKYETDGLLALVAVLAVACGTPDRGGAPAADSAPAQDTATPADSGGADADTWANFAQGFFQDYCVQCHSSGDKDFRTYDAVAAYADEIRCGVATEVLDGCGSWPPPEQFPIGNGPKPSDSERERLVAWIDAGLPK